MTTKDPSLFLVARVLPFFFILLSSLPLLRDSHAGPSLFIAAMRLPSVMTLPGPLPASVLANTAAPYEAAERSLSPPHDRRDVSPSPSRALPFLPPTATSQLMDVLNMVGLFSLLT